MLDIWCKETADRSPLYPVGAFRREKIPEGVYGMIGARCFVLRPSEMKFRTNFGICTFRCQTVLFALFSFLWRIHRSPCLPARTVTTAA